uniref:TPR_MLP1_2 domain-containing protein n=1 Tax=Macrostomum lignano TaxID=282301 RepID=A0A1I8JM48_9PLAT
MASAGGDPADSTDFTVSSADREQSDSANSSPKRAGSSAPQGPLDRRTLMHELQLAKIQLSQRTAELESRQEQWNSREEDLVDRLGSAERECAQLRQQLEHDLSIPDDRARHLQSLQEDELSVRDLVCLRLHQQLQPLRQQLEETGERAKVATEERDRLYDEADKLRDCLAGERRLHQALQESYQKAVSELADVRSQVHSGNYKVAHFDEVKHDRDRLSSQCEQLQSALSALEQQVASVAKERDQLARDLASSQQTVQLLRQDTTYLSNQIGELSSRAAHAEDRCAGLQKQLDDARAAREAAIERSLAERDRLRGEFELRLHSELDRLRTGGEAELDRLRRQTLDMQEAQVKAMREQRDQAVLERESAVARLDDAEDRLRDAREQLARAAAAADKRTTELTAELRDRATLLLKEANAKLEEAALEQERLRAKLQSAEQEFAKLEQASRRHQLDQQAKIDQLTASLEAYESAERELDQAVLQAAEIGKPGDDGCSPDQIIAAGVAMPTTARRRLRQSVELAKRVLQLERQSVELNTALEKQRSEAARYKREFERLEATLSDAEQPYGYLVDSIRARDAELEKTRQQLSEAEARLESLAVDRNRLAEAKNRMSADLERLLAQRDEVAMLRKTVAAMQSKRVGSGRVAASRPRIEPRAPDFEFEDQDELKPSQPYALHYS